MAVLLPCPLLSWLTWLTGPCEPRLTPPWRQNAPGCNSLPQCYDLHWLLGPIYVPFLLSLVFLCISMVVSFLFSLFSSTSWLWILYWGAKASWHKANSLGVVSWIYFSFFFFFFHCASSLNRLYLSGLLQRWQMLPKVPPPPHTHTHHTHTSLPQFPVLSVDVWYAWNVMVVVCHFIDYREHNVMIGV